MNKSVYAVALVPIVAGALGACSHPHPSPAQDAPFIDSPAPAAPTVPPNLQPDFGTVVHRDEPPPPISGGTLTIATDGKTAIAADADRDRVYVVDLVRAAVRHTLQLPKHSEPGRVAVDDRGHAYVVLRRAGGLATIDLATGSLSTRDVCIAPRGLAFDKGQAAVHVACANGELVTVPVGPARGRTNPLQRRVLDRDLRDVVMQNDGSMMVTTFRSAAKILVPKDGSPVVTTPSSNGANLAWRAIAIPPSDAIAVVQQQPTAPDVNGANYYAGDATFDPDLESSGCGPVDGILTVQLTLGAGSVNLPEAVLPVDLATNGRELAVVAAGNAFTKRLAQVFVVSAATLKGATDGHCIFTVHGNVPGQAVAAAFDANDTLIVQTREPAALHIMTADRRRPSNSITLAADSVADTGHAIFHANSGASIACASCHAEGADDGHVWTFGDLLRRTPSLLGTVAGTQPYHWDGDQKDLGELVEHVFVERMNGPRVDDAQLGALSGWLFALPAPAKLRAESEVTARGGALFQERCASCHAGGMLTNNATVDVGTGGAFQVPSLVGVGWRQPLLHAGCAKTLLDRFDPSCGGAHHGDTASLSTDQVHDLVQFLETL